MASVSTDDAEVRQQLRTLGQPQTLFGEGVSENGFASTLCFQRYERRERLANLLQAGSGQTQDVVVVQARDDGELAVEELFFTEGTASLKETRKWIAEFSLPRAYERLRKESSTTQEPDMSIITTLENNLEVQLSQVADSRPISYGKFCVGTAEYLATSSFSSHISVWNGREGSLVAKWGQPEYHRCISLAWSPKFIAYGCEDEDQFAMASCDSNGVIKLWSWNKGQGDVVKTLRGHEDRVNRLDFHPSGRFLASSSHDETWRFWDIQTGIELVLQEGHARSVYPIKHHPDGSILASADLGGIIRLWDLRTGRTVLHLTGHVKQILSLDFHPLVPHQLASGSGDCSVKIWDLRHKECSDTLLAHRDLISSVMYEPKFGRYLMTSSFDRTARFWSNKDYKCFKVLSGHESIISAADICDDGSVMATVSYDRTFKLWRWGDSIDRKK